MERKKMLIAEDSFADVMLIKLAIEDANLPLEVLHMPDGEEMIHYLRNHQSNDIQFMLLDLNIPKATGLDILKFKSTLSNWQSVPVILYSSSTRQEDIRQSIALGANAYVCKPVDFDQFNKTIQYLAVFWGEINLIGHR